MKKIKTKSGIVSVIALVSLVTLVMVAFPGQFACADDLPAKISTDRGITNNWCPQMALDSSGYLHVSWFGNDGTTDQTWYADNTSGAWSAPTRISTDPGVTDNWSSQIALDSSGYSNVTWSGHDGTTNQIYCTDNTSGAWSTPTRISTDPGVTDNWWPQIVLDSSGCSHITWYGSDGTSWQVYCTDNTSGAWSAPTRISNDPGVTGNVCPLIALDSSGCSHITWWGNDGITEQIYCTDNTSGAWSAPTRISTDPGVIDNLDPQIALDSSGYSHVIWYGKDGTTNQIYYVDNTSGAWSAPTRISIDPGVTDNWFPQMALDSSGCLYVTWWGSDGTTNQIYYTDNTSGAWSTPTRISTDPGVTRNRWPQIELDSSGCSHIIWYGGDGNTCQIFYSSISSPSGDIVEPTITSIDPTGRTAGDPAFTLTVNGTNFVVGSTVRWNGADRTTTYISDTRLTAVIPASDIASAGTANVTVFNPAPGGGTSNARTFTVNQPAPTTPDVTGVVPESGPPGTEITVNGSNFGNTRGSGDTGGAASYVAFGGAPAIEYNLWSDTRIICTVPEGATTGAVKVVTSAGTFNTDKDFTVAYTTWYLAEGSTAWGYDCYITIKNPNNAAVSATVTYMTDAGEVPGGDIDMPAMSQATINPRGILGDKDFSTQVECKQGKTIAVDRTMTWTGEGAPSPDGHCSIGVTSHATTWYLPEGSSAWGFECWLLIQNPNPTEATAQVIYMIEGEAPQTFEKKIPGGSRKTYNMANDIGEKDASIKVQADMPVIPERAMYRNNGRSGHDSIGTTAPALSYYLAEGTTVHGFTTYVLVQNPQATATEVTVTYMTNSGPVPQGSFTMPANSRKTIRVNDVMPGADFSTQVTGSQPIIAERAMYWGDTGGSGEASHDSIGLAAPHDTFYLPDGETSNGRETYTLVMNPNDTTVEVQISYLTPDGTGNVTFEETVGANSRKTLKMADKGITGRSAVMVTCKTVDKKIMVERSMYWNDRGAGTCTIGGFEG